jgi:hypothetical protein
MALTFSPVQRFKLVFKFVDFEEFPTSVRNLCLLSGAQVEPRDIWDCWTVDSGHR